MARAFTNAQRDLLKAPAIKLHLLVTFFLDAGTYRFCDDVMDLYDPTNNFTYIGASALTNQVEYHSGRDLAAEPITLVLDGNRMAQAGIADPARVLRDILGYLYQQRRVDFAFAVSYPDSLNIGLVIPIAAMKINYARLVDSEMSLEDNDGVVSKLEIVLDSLAARYGKNTFRTRSHEDQLEIDPTDMFFSFAADVVASEKTIYWGKNAPMSGNGDDRVPANIKLIGTRGDPRWEAL